MQQRAQRIQVIIPAPAATVREEESERWPPGASTVFAAGVSLALWGCIYLAASALFL
jgi:hypothetical protein